MKLTVNSDPLEVADGSSLHSLLQQLDKAGRPGIAVAVNGAVVPAAGWPSHALHPDDAVLVIQATQGG